MLKFNRSKKRLVIPVGINPSYGIDSSTLYSVSDADIDASDVLEGKIGYGKDGKIVGTLDVQGEKEESYQEGYEFGYNEGNNAGYQLGYDEGNEAGIEIGKAEVIESMNDATITAGTVFKGEIGYGKDGERIVGDYEFVEGFDFGVIGYNTEESNEINRNISDDIAYSKQLMDEWDPNRTSVSGYFQGNTSLVYAPKIDTSNTTDMSYMFQNCSNLTSVPLFDTSNVTSMSNMFYICLNLTIVPLFDTSKVTNMYAMFHGCSSLTSVPLFDTSKVTNMYAMFFGCSSLTSVPLFDTSNVDNMREMFYGCKNLTTVPEFDTSGMTGSAYYCTEIFGMSNYVTDFGGFKDLGKSYQNSNNSYRDVVLYSQSKLSYESCMNVINKVYDLTLKPDYNNTPKIRFNATSYALLSPDDIAIATAKGWTVQAG